MPTVVSPPNFCLTMSLTSLRARAAPLFAAALLSIPACETRLSEAQLTARDSVRLVELPARLASLPQPAADATPDSLRAERLSESRRRGPRMSPLADTIASSLVFMVRGRNAFTAAGRAKRLLVDIGRVDAPLKSPERMSAYREAASALSPVRPGDAIRLRGPWGSDVARVRELDAWNGRIVLALELSPALDSLVRRRDPLVALAVRGDTSAATIDGCRREALSPGLSARLKQLGDSVEQLVRADTAALSDRLRRSLRVHRSRAAGCFGVARALLVVTAQAGGYEWVRETAFLVEPSGAATVLRVRDPNFSAHEVLHALDADGDGVDDVATRARRERSGGTTILRLDTGEMKLERLASGFVWEG